MIFFKSKTIIFLILIFTSKILISQSTILNFNSLLESGNAEMANKNIASAYYYYTTALKFNKQSLEVVQKKQTIEDEFNKNPQLKNSLIEELIIKGENFFKEKKYAEAQKSFLIALTLDQNSQFIKDRLFVINSVYKNPAEEAFYKEVLNEGDKLVLSREYDLAIDEYNKAFIFKPGDKLTKTKIDNAIFEKSDLADNKLRINDLIADGDRLFTQFKYEESLSKYNAAQKVMPNDLSIAEKIKKVEKAIAEKQNLQVMFENAISQGDENYIQRNFDKAAENYQIALNIKPDAMYPKEMLDKSKKAAAEFKAKNEKYVELITKADGYFDAKSYTEALTEYKNATELKPDEKYPKDKIAIINEIILNKETLDKNYNTALEKANNFYTLKDWQNALTSYVEANKLKPSEKLPSDRIEELNILITKIQLENKNYNQIIAQADSAFNAKLYSQSIAAYKNALALKSQEIYPKEQIALAEKNLKQIEDAQNSYNTLISEADLLFNSEKYSEASNKYLNASQIKPSETYPKQKIEEISAIIKQIESQQKEYNEAIAKADEFFKNQNWLSSVEFYEKALTVKADEKYPLEQIKLAREFHQNIEKLNSEYNSNIDIADNLFEQKKYTESIVEYEKASRLKPSEGYPKQKISEANSIINQIAETENRYNNLISEGNTRFLNKDYTNALTSFESASALKPEQNLPKEKINEIKSILQQIEDVNSRYNNAIEIADGYFNQDKLNEALEPYQKASSIKPEEQYPKNQIEKINSLLAQKQELKNQYDQILIVANKMYDEKKYNDALEKYKQLTNLIPAEEFPKNRISEIEKILLDINAKEKSYNDAIAEADNFFNGKRYQESIEKYNIALGFKPEDIYSINKISEATKLLEDINKSYNLAVESGNFARQQENFEKAISEFNKASEIKPNEEYPKNQVAEIQKIINDRAQAINDKYNAFITNADNYFNSEDYNSAIREYTSASEVKPDESYPKQKIETAKQKIESLKAARSKEYNDALAVADNFYENKIFDQAIEAYEKAQLLSPTDSYPKNQIAKIKQYLADHAIHNLFNQVTVINAGEEKKFNFEIIEPRLRRNNYVLLKLKSNDENNPNVFINYGNNSQKNGGVVLRQIKQEGVNEYLVRISVQDKWYREDNNWISLIVEGGSVEVSGVQIATAD